MSETNACFVAWAKVILLVLNSVLRRTFYYVPLPCLHGWQHMRIFVHTQEMSHIRGELSLCQGYCSPLIVFSPFTIPSSSVSVSFAVLSPHISTFLSLPPSLFLISIISLFHPFFFFLSSSLLFLCTKMRKDKEVMWLEQIGTEWSWTITNLPQWNVNLSKLPCQFFFSFILSGSNNRNVYWPRDQEGSLPNSWS